MKGNLMLGRIGAMGVFAGFAFGILLVALLGRRFPCIFFVGWIGALMSYGLAVAAGKCQDCQESLIGKASPPIKGVLNLLLMAIWVPVPCSQCGHQNK